MRAQKVARIAQDIGELELAGADGGDVLVIGWGGTYGAIAAGASARAPTGKKVSHAHLRWLSPLPRDLAKSCATSSTCSSPSSTWASCAARARAVPRRRAWAQQDPGPAVQGPRDRRDAHRAGCSRSRTEMTATDREAHREGPRVRPGRPLVPGLRRLRDPRDGAAHARAARRQAREHRVRLRDRLLEPVPVLHEHVRLPHDPRPRAGDRVRPQDVAPRALRLGHHRRRRRPVDRRQPHDPRAAAQHGSQDHPVQQPDLRAHEGPVLADLGARHGDEVDADGLDRLTRQPDLARARRGGDVRRARGRHRREADGRRPARGGRARGARSSRSCRTARSSTTACGSSCATTRRA